MLKAAMPSRALRQIIAPSSASVIANFQTAGLRCGTRTPTIPSFRYLSVKASLKTALSDGTSRTLTRSGVSATHACLQLRAKAIRLPALLVRARRPRQSYAGDYASGDHRRSRAVREWRARHL